jgi:hypothetical protein
MKSSRIALLGAGLLALLPAASFSDNQTLATASQYVVGQGWITVSSLLGGPPSRFYRFGVVAGRSYCGETAAADFGNDIADTALILRSDSGALITARDDYDSEPSADLTSPGPSRVCWVATVANGISNTFEEFDFTANANRKFRIVDTSMWCPWFLTGGGFDAFVLIKNTTNQVFNVQTSLYNTLGLQMGTTVSQTITPNGSLNYQLSTFPFSVASDSGTIQISHTGPPGALVANTTTLSFAQGVSFDTPFSGRADYRQ